MGKKKELTILERKAIRSWGGWQLANLLIMPNARPSDGGTGGRSNPRGFGEGHWMETSRGGIKVTKWEKTFGADRTEKEPVVTVKWQQVFDLAAGMTPSLRERIKKVCAQHRKHQSQGFHFQRPLLEKDGDRAEFERKVDEFNKKIYYPWLDAGKLITERIDALLDEAVGSLDGLDAQAEVERINATLARLSA